MYTRDVHLAHQPPPRSLGGVLQLTSPFVLQQVCGRNNKRRAARNEHGVPIHFLVSSALSTTLLLRRRMLQHTRRCAKQAGNSAVIASPKIDEANIEIGMRVQVVADDVGFFHAPHARGSRYNPKGCTGVVVDIVDDESLTANRAVWVKITGQPATLVSDNFRPFKAYFEAEELCICNRMAADVDESRIMPEASVSNAESDTWKINLLFDGECPSCMKQVEFLEKRMDENPEYAGLVRLTDLHAPNYSPAECGGVIFEDGMRHIHAVTRDGEVIVGMDVFRRVYSIVGMEWVYTMTTLPLVGSLLDWLYDVWAEYRLQLSGRTDILERVRQHRDRIEQLSAEECDVECEIDWDNPEANTVSETAWRAPK